MIVIGGVSYFLTWFTVATFVATGLNSNINGGKFPEMLELLYTLQFHLVFWMMICVPSTFLNAVFAKIQMRIKSKIRSFIIFLIIGIITGSFSALIVAFSIGSEITRFNVFVAFGIPVFAACIVSSCLLGVLCFSKATRKFDDMESFSN